MATEDQLRNELEIALGKKPGKKNTDALGQGPVKTTVTDVGTRQFPQVQEQPAQSLGAPVRSAEFSDQRIQNIAQTGREPLPSTIEGPPDLTGRIGEQLFGERQADVFGAFDTQGNRIVSKANQRNQAAFGNIGGAQTSDASGTGAQSNNLPPNPVAQLASLRETFGTQSGPTGGVAFAPNSATRERNARLNDPRRQFLGDLQRQVRRGEISARAAGGIAANILGQQADLQLGAEKLGSAERIAANKRALERLQIASQEGIAGAKLAEGTRQAALDRASTEATAQSKAATEAAKLGLGVEKLTETQRANLQSEAQKAQQLEQSRTMKLAEMLQQGQLRGADIEQDRQKLAFNLVKGLSEGADQDATMNLLRQVAPELFGNIE